jgi:hypothetical protein
MIALLALLAHPAAGPQPTISGLVLTSNAGACGAPHRVSTAASVDAHWSVSGTNDVLYEVHVSVNGESPTVLASTATVTFSTTLTGRVENNDGHVLTIATSVEVRVVRKSDSVVVQTLSGLYTSDYGDCSGLA